MAKIWAKRFYNSDKWKACRRGYIAHRKAIDSGWCEECHEDAGYIVHHTTLLTKENINDPNISLNWDNLMFVCKKCHDKYDDHFWQARNRKEIKCTFDESGQPVDLRNI